MPSFVIPSFFRGNDVAQSKHKTSFFLTFFLVLVLIPEKKCLIMSPSACPGLKAVILIAGPQKGTRFRPLSLDVPKPLFPVAGLPLIQHHIEALSQVDQMREILILGFYPNGDMTEFVQDMNHRYNKVTVKYLQEYTSLGTAGGIYHFRDRIMSGNPEAFFVLNGDICADFPLHEMMAFHQESALPDVMATLLATEATKPQSLNYGCVVEDKNTHQMLHYVEKPNSYISSQINCGVYVFSPEIFQVLADKYQQRQRRSETPDAEEPECMWIERDVLSHMVTTGRGQVFSTTNWWSQIKTAGSVIYANRHYLKLYAQSHPERLYRPTETKTIGNVFVHPSASIHATAVLGPNVSIGPNVIVGMGTRISESIILADTSIGDHSLIKHAVLGMNTRVGHWTRIEGTPNDPNPNKAFAKMDNLPLFSQEGKLNPSVTVIGCNVVVPSEVIVLNSIVLPHKQISHSFKNEIIL